MFISLSSYFFWCALTEHNNKVDKDWTTLNNVIEKKKNLHMLSENFSNFFFGMCLSVKSFIYSFAGQNSSFLSL